MIPPAVAPAAPAAPQAPAARPHAPAAPPARGSLPGGMLAALAALCALLFLVRLDGPFLYDDGEARYATAVREMAQTGRWLAPQFQGRPVSKPPLVFWAMAAARSLLGDGERAARLPSALAGIAAVLATAGLAARLFGASAGFLAGVLLATMFQFIWVARRGQLDMPLVAFTTGAQVFLFRGLQEGRPRLWAAGYACVALGAMAKGLSGAALPLGTLLLYAALGGRLRALGAGPAWRAAAGAAAIVVAYYAALGPRFLREFVQEDHLRRFVAGVDVVEPWWWYFPFLALALLPYTGWVPFAASALRPGPGPSPAGSGWRQDPATFPACWFVLWFVLISVSQGKQEQYALPLMPPLAMLVAAGILRGSAPGRELWTRLGVASVPATVAVGSLVFLGYLARQGLLAPWPAAAFTGLALAGLAGTWGAFRWAQRRALAAATLCGVLTSLAVITAALPALEGWRAAAPLAAARAIREAVGEAPVVSFGGAYTPTPRVTYYMGLPRPLRRIEAPRELDAFLREDRASYLLLPASDHGSLDRARAAGRGVMRRVSTGRADYVLLGPPGRD